MTSLKLSASSVAKPSTLSSTQPTAAFANAASVFSQIRGRSGIGGKLLDGSDWMSAQLFCPVLQAASKAKETVLQTKVLVPVAVAVTLVFNPMLLKQLQTDSGPLLDAIKAANNFMDKSMIGRWALDVIQSVSHFPLLLESNTLVQQSRPPLVNGAILAGGLAQIFALGYPVVKVFENVLSRVNRGERLRLGNEPLPAGSKPRLAFMGPSDFVDTLLENAPRVRRDMKRPIVLVHQDEVIPSVYSDGRVDYHARYSSRLGPRLVSKETLDSFGVSRAERVVLVGFNPNKAVFYGNSESGSITPSMCSTYLSILASQPSPETKNVVIIVPRGAKLLAGTTSFAELLAPEENLMKQLAAQGVKVHVIHPEDVLLELLKKELTKLKADLSAACPPGSAEPPINICLIGDRDVAALRAFARALEALPFGAKVNILADEILGDITGNTFHDLTEEQRRVKKCELLQQSHLNLVYGGDDTATTDLGAVAIRDAERALGAASPEKGQTLCIIETSHGCQDARVLGLRNLSIYEALRERVEQALADS
jgi:hypothetical protein